MRIPKSSNSTIPRKRFRSVALTSYDLKLAERAVLGRLTSSVGVPDDSLQSAYKPNRSTFYVGLSLVHYITKSLDASAKSFRSAFLDIPSAFEFVPRSLLFRKLEPFGFPNRFLVWLSNCFTNGIQCARLGRRKSTPLVNDCGILQGAVPSSYMFSTYISHVHANYPCQVFIYADEVVLCQSVSGTEDIFKLSNNLPLIHDFSVPSGLNLNSSKCVKCLFSFYRSVYPADPSSINT